jgi:hypothetical protein
MRCPPPSDCKANDPFAEDALSTSTVVVRLAQSPDLEVRKSLGVSKRL